MNFIPGAPAAFSFCLVDSSYNPDSIWFGSVCYGSQEVYVEGIVRGNVFANDVKIKNNGMLLGDIQCVCLTLDPTASIKVSPPMSCHVMHWYM